ncbi:DUF2214 family protein [Prochlorococcus marinus]|uniref:Predicted membrane protein n=1 Tax=Prochlorococcus marinus (strain MIT 9211) TaxID=93059 RepID=A9BBZ1_PROM4|nr:DUF2214 family protein [Prochlorococcus marinus]ABX09353.1 Predicted membrane protein [Prochlorococcus marinus str. MIT 9211]
MSLVFASFNVNSALVAYIHYLSIILCFGALIYERLSLKIDPNRIEAISMVIADVVYGLAGLSLLISGILRVKYFGEPPEFYTHNPIFWCKVGIYVFVGLLSLYPTITYILWAIPLSKNKLPVVGENLVSRLRLLINIEITGFCLIPLFATLMARGIGL